MSTKTYPDFDPRDHVSIEVEENGLVRTYIVTTLEHLGPSAASHRYEKNFSTEIAKGLHFGSYVYEHFRDATIGTSGYRWLLIRRELIKVIGWTEADADAFDRVNPP
jgi:hypothetical protein